MKLTHKTPWWTTILSLTVGAALGAGAVWLMYRGERKPARQAAPTALAKVPAEKAKPVVRHRLGHHRSTLGFRVEDATNHNAIGLARIRIENLGLAVELGDDEEAIAWPDGRAQITQKFLVIVPEKDRLLFCSAANHVFIPRWLSRGPGPFPGGFRKRPLEGAPNVPIELKPYILAKPVTGIITELIAEDTGILDKGANDGIRAGMIFGKEDNDASAHYTVLYAEEERCIIKDLSQYDPMSWDFRTFDLFPLVAGRKMSTHSATVETKGKSK